MDPRPLSSMPVLDTSTGDQLATPPELVLGAKPRRSCPAKDCPNLTASMLCDEHWKGIPQGLRKAFNAELKRMKKIGQKKPSLRLDALGRLILGPLLPRRMGGTR